MRRRHVLLIIIIIVALYFSAWHLGPERKVNLLVVDKTVPETDYREHRAIFWVLKHNRFTNPQGEFMRYDRDYLGYHPEKERMETLTAADLETVEILYLADSYGIYDYEEGLEVYEEKLPYEHQEIELIYGGFDRYEVEEAARFANREGAVLIGEHNIFGYPTYLDQEAAKLLQELFAVRYGGWLTRYYANLDEAAFWIKELYSRIYGLEWDLEGAGMIFVREDVTGLGWYTDLVIIESKDFNAPWPVITGAGHELLDGASSAVPYLYWVEILEIDSDIDEAEVLAYFEPPFGEEAGAALRDRGLPELFPAVIYYPAPDGAKRIYFAGDFADQLPALLPPSLTGSATIQRALSYMPGMPVEYRFYFQWYAPVLTNILELEKE